MAMKIDIVDYDSKTYDMVKSDREYIEHQITTTETVAEDDGYYGAPTMGVKRFYEDDETGIITRDVAKFEAWMRSVSPR